MSDLLVPALMLLAALVVGVVRHSVAPRLAARRGRRHRPVRVPVKAGPPGSLKAGWLVRVGSEARVVTPRLHWAVPASQLRAAPARGVVDSAEGSVARGYELAGPEGDPGIVEVGDEWAQVLERVLDNHAPTFGARARAPLRAGLPRYLVPLAALLLLGSAVAFAIGAFSVERTSPVMRIAETDGVSSCFVEWRESGQTYTGAPECPDPVPRVGDPLTYLTTPWPFTGNAWDPVLAEVMVVLPAAVGVPLLGVAVAVAWRRTRRPATVYSSVGGPETSPVPGASAVGNGPVAVPDEADLAALLERAAEVLRWSDQPEHPPRQRGSEWWADVRRALAATPRGLLVAGLFATLFAWSRDWPGRVVAGLALASGLAALWSLWRFAAVLRQLRETWTEPFTSEWDLRAMRTPTGEWLLLLMLGRTPRWSVAVPGRPPLAGTALVRGDLSEGGSIHVKVGDDLWLPDGGVVRVDDEAAVELRDMLTFQLTGSLPSEEDLSAR